MVVPAIPPELVRQIVDEIPQERIKSSLCAAALVSHTFRAEAQRVLFFDPGVLDIGLPDQHHNRFIDAILSAPDRLAPLVWRYQQVTVAKSPTANIAAYSSSSSSSSSSSASESESPTDDDTDTVTGSDDDGEHRAVVTKVARALQLMVNLKHLALHDIVVVYLQTRYSVADRLLQQCTFKLESLSWDCREDLFLLITQILPTQDQLRYLHLHSAYPDERLAKKQFRDVAKDAMPMLDSLSAPFLVSQLLIPGKQIKYLRWTGARRVEIDDVPRLAALSFAEVLDLDMLAAPTLWGVVGYLTNLKLLKIDLFNLHDQTHVSELAAINQLTSLRMLVLCTSNYSCRTVVNEMDFQELFASCTLLECVDVQHDGDTAWILRRSMSEDHIEVTAKQVPVSEMYNWDRRADFV